MAQIQTLQDRLSGETVYPVTTPKAVIDERGVDLETLMAQQKQDNGNALKEYVKKTEQAQELAQKQNKLTPTTDLHITDDNVIGLTELAKMRLFIDMWNKACGWYDPKHPFGKYNESTGFFELNGLTDITYQEAIQIYNITSCPPTNCGWWGCTMRTNLWYQPNTSFGSGWDEGEPIHSLFKGSSVEVARIARSDNSIYYSIHIGTFDNCRNLKRVVGIMGDYSRGASSRPIRFNYCYELEDVKIHHLLGDVDMRYSSKISLDSLQYTVQYKHDNVSYAITITVHPDVYAKLTGDTTNAAAANLSEEELAQWMALIPLAAEKNITFATV